jgi:thioredoxin reductase (NADPH)
MSSQKIYDVAIIGAGPAGMTAGIYTARAGYSTALIEELSPGGQMAQTEHLENYPGFNGSTSGYELSEIMYAQVESFGVETIYDQVVAVNFDASPMELKLAFGEVLAKSVIVASGSRPAKLGIDGEDNLLGAGVSYCATCDGNFYKGRIACVVGGGDTAVADVIYLSRICSKVYLIVRRDVLRATAIYNNRLAELENVEIIWNSVCDKLESKDGYLSAIHIKPSSNASIQNEEAEGASRRIETSALFVAVGTVPNVEFLDGALECDPAGRIIANEMGATSMPGVFAAGDVRTKALRQVSTAVGDGANCATSVADYLLQNS